MGLLSRLLNREEVDLEQRAPQTGVKFKDLLVLQQLAAAGADLTAPRHVLYYLYFTDHEEAVIAASSAEAHGFSAQVNPPLPKYPDRWGLVCERHDYQLDMENVRDNTDMFEALAATHGGDYDGWEASVS